MPAETTKYIIIGIIGGVFLVLFLGGIVITFAIEYRKRQMKNREEMLLEKMKNEQIILQTQFEVQEQTRKNLAADLHDNIGQLLSLTNVTLASINIDERDKTLQKLSDTHELLTRSIRELRQLSKIIHGEQLIQQGLLKTIEQEITWLERNGHYSVELTHNLPVLDISTADKDLFLYRLLQECLNNIIKHSGGNRIRIQIHYEDHALQLSITDNGTGFNVAEKLKTNSSMGLASMQKRTQLMKGQMQIQSKVETGTSIVFTIPYP